MMHAGDIMSTVGGVQYHGEYHPLKFEYHGGYRDTCGGYHEYRGGVLYRGYSPHGTEHPHGTHDIPTCIMISPWYSR